MNQSKIRFGSLNDEGRSEDMPLLTGKGEFTDDLKAVDQLYAVFLRSPLAHATIESINTDIALNVSGVAAVYTGDDLDASGIGPVPAAISINGSDGQPMLHAPVPVLATKRIRYLGEPIAIVIGSSLDAAIEGSESIKLSLREQPAASTVEAALAPGAPAIYEQATDNVALDWHDGDISETDKVFAAAATIVETQISNARLAPATLEPRSGIGEWDETSQQFRLIAGTQGVNLVASILAEHVFKIGKEDLHVVTNDVGGGFGMKSQPYSEYAAILFAAKEIGLPVKWTNTRQESFQTDTAGRDGELKGKMALDANGKILALKFKISVGMGAYISTFGAVFAVNNTRNCLSSVYVIPKIYTNVKMIMTNAAPLGPYRGAGRPEAIIMIERLLDLAATACNLDKVTIRRRNLIPASLIPYKTPVDQIYDSGEFEAILDQACKVARWEDFEKRREESEKKGKLRGIGICCFLEIAGGILNEPAQICIQKRKVLIKLGVQEMGQGHQTTFTNLVSNRLNISSKDVGLVEGDSAEVPGFIPAVASRSLMMAGSAAVLACDKLVDNGREIASQILEAATVDIDYNSGVYQIRGTDKTVRLLDLPSLANAANLSSSKLDITQEFVSPQMSFPNGCHICEVEIDPETGMLAIVNYVAVDDVGRVLEEQIVEGQIHGGIVQGLGQVLGEQVIYDHSGQLLTGSFMDYPVPRADEIPALAISSYEVLCANNPLGIKGAGESGVAGALPSGYSAILDALSTRNVKDFVLPATPARLWKALQ